MGHRRGSSEDKKNLENLLQGWGPEVYLGGGGGGVWWGERRFNRGGSRERFHRVSAPRLEKKKSCHTTRMSKQRFYALHPKAKEGIAVVGIKHGAGCTRLETDYREYEETYRIDPNSS